MRLDITRKKIKMDILISKYNTDILLMLLLVLPPLLTVGHGHSCL